ncbi:unnamed protein product [Fraxinus pennsylvanica]|uniref:S-adenosylmethionine-dependent methyltransferase n=1 Tax=Fraxinus pennsylvanica TaxID=56036 RepID=A0AAD1ZGY8_9LAMI|nr:unnamed protein product [Fraxinus pennsylvanica]
MAEDQFYAMNEGDGHQSYAKNSSYQGGVTEAAKEIIKEEISQKLDIENLSLTSTNSIRIADFGCSSGPNTFNAMQIIVESIKKKIETVSHQMPEFQVFFNDRTSNDFNILFALLPSERQYYAAGVPGSFHGRVFPKDSLHFAYSSCALTWLSEIPKEETRDPTLLSESQKARNRNFNQLGCNNRRSLVSCSYGNGAPRVPKKRPDAKFGS